MGVLVVDHEDQVGEVLYVLYVFLWCGERESAFGLFVVVVVCVGWGCDFDVEYHRYEFVWSVAATCSATCSRIWLAACSARATCSCLAADAALRVMNQSVATVMAYGAYHEGETSYAAYSHGVMVVKRSVVTVRAPAILVILVGCVVDMFRWYHAVLRLRNVGA